MVRQSVGSLSKKQQIQQLIKQELFQEAAVACKKLCKKTPRDIDSWFLFGAINGRIGDFNAAAECCRKVIKLDPNHVAAHYNLSIALRDAGKLEAASRTLKKTLRLAPEYKNARSTLGNVLISMGQYDEAEKVFIEAMKEDPDNPEFYASMGSVMQTSGQLEASVSSYQKALLLNYDKESEVLDNLAGVYCLQGKYDKSIKTYREALGLRPDDPRIYSNLLLTQHYIPDITESELRSSHEQWPLVAAKQVLGYQFESRAKNPDRRLKVGYVSSDLREHSVSYFFEPLLEAHNHNNVEVFCYHNSLRSDFMTKRMMSFADHWAITEKQDDKALADRIYNDEIDILVDLNGHTAGNRLSVFAMKPAPLQITYLGYPNTTGLAAMDYRLTDMLSDPESSEAAYVEKLVRLSHFLCYKPPESSPEVAELPALSNGYVTYGSFNNLAKINHSVIRLWSRLLIETPESRLVLKNGSLTDLASRERLVQAFVDEGIDAERLDFLAYTKSTADHMSIYSRVDIALDTFPYNGTTTTCEALWMGVPVVSLSGASHRARVGKSLLTQVGEPGWVAETDDQYIAVAKALAENIQRLSQHRSSMRERINTSGLTNAKVLAGEIESAYSQMWREWLARD